MRVGKTWSQRKKIKCVGGSGRHFTLVSSEGRGAHGGKRAGTLREAARLIRKAQGTSPSKEGWTPHREVAEESAVLGKIRIFCQAKIREGGKHVRGKNPQRGCKGASLYVFQERRTNPPFRTKESGETRSTAKSYKERGPVRIGGEWWDRQKGRLSPEDTQLPLGVSEKDKSGAKEKRGKGPRGAKGSQNVRNADHQNGSFFPAKGKKGERQNPFWKSEAKGFEGA